MSGEVSLFGVYVPGLLLLAMAAVLLTGLLVKLLSFLGAYRLFAYRPLVDVALFFLVLGALVLMFAQPDTLS